MADRWLTYEEAGALFGLSAEAMRKRARRLRWQVQAPNDSQGKARILVPAGAELRPAGPPPRNPSGDRPDDRPDALFAELRRRAEAAEADRDRERTERERVEGERERLAAELITERERRARAEGEAAAYRINLENALGRADRAEARADAEARTAIEGRQQVTEATVRASLLEAERDGTRAAAEVAQAARQAAEAELAGWAAGGPLARAWRGFWGRRT